MSSAVAKLGPLFAVAGLAGYCLLPALAPAPLAREARVEPPPKLDSGLLAPRLEPPLERDPFQAAPVVAAAPGKTTSRSGLASTATLKPTGPNLPEGLHLGATLVHGRRRAAVINDRVYKEGERVAPPRAEASPDPAGPGAPPGPQPAAAGEPAVLVLARVEHDRVWIDVPWQGRMVPLELPYVARTKRAASTDLAGATGTAITATATSAPAFEPGSLEHLQELTANPQYAALMTLAQGLLGRGLLPGGGIDAAKSRRGPAGVTAARRVPGSMARGGTGGMGAGGGAAARPQVAGRAGTPLMNPTGTVNRRVP
jgi:hypothetical protein